MGQRGAITGNGTSLKDILAWKAQAFATVAINESKTTFCHTVQLRPIRQRNTLLDAVFPADLINFPHFSSLASSDRMIQDAVQTDVSQLIPGLSVTAQKVLPRYPSLIIPNDHGILAPFDLTAFLPLRSTKTLPSFLSERHLVTLLTGALMAFTIEHPTHDSSLLPFFSFTPCCSADLSNTRW